MTSCFLVVHSILRKVILYKERICSLWEHFFPYREDPISEGDNILTVVFSESVSILLNVKRNISLSKQFCFLFENGSSLNNTNVLCITGNYFLLEKFHFRKGIGVQESKQKVIKLHVKMAVLLSRVSSPLKVKRYSFTITKTRLFKYIKNFITKNWKLSDEKFWKFSYFCSKQIVGTC